MSKTRVMKELWELMRAHQKYWLAPIIILLFIIGMLLVVAKGSALAPFIYTLF